MSNRFTRRAALLGVGAIIGAAGVGVGYAAIPASDGTITGCYTAQSGQLRVIDAEGGATCTRNEKPLTWNQTGPTGAPGATNVVTRFIDVEQVGRIEGIARCEEGERAVSGGFHVGGNGFEVTTFINRPSPATQGSTPTGWEVLAGVPNTTAPTVGRIYVVCASP